MLCSILLYFTYFDNICLCFYLFSLQTFNGIIDTIVLGLLSYYLFSVYTLFVFWSSIPFFFFFSLFEYVFEFNLYIYFSVVYIPFCYIFRITLGLEYFSWNVLSLFRFYIVAGFILITHVWIKWFFLAWLLEGSFPEEWASIIFQAGEKCFHALGWRAWEVY